MKHSFLIRLFPLLFKAFSNDQWKGDCVQPAKEEKDYVEIF